MATRKKSKAQSGSANPGGAFEHDLRFTADFCDEYSGYTSSPGAQLSRVLPSISAEEFFEKYVKTRRPCIIEGFFDDESWRRTVWDPSNLVAKAGDEVVKVEVKDEQHPRFGLGNEKQMVFRDFVNCWSAGDASLYMTTQDLDCDEEGRPFLTAAPASNLIGSFPWNPRVTGNLVLQTLNLWMGCSEKPMTSGLHHDFHDNFYLLLVGTKRFRLLPPNAAANLYLSGTVAKIHKNGRINFEGQITTADGVSEDALRSHEALAKLEAACKASEEDDSEVEAALEQLLDAEHDDFVEDGDSDEDDHDEEDDGEDENGYEEKRQEDDNDDEYEEQAERTTTTSNKRTRECTTTEAERPNVPNNFSRIDLSQDRKDIVKQFPRFDAVADNIVECTIRAGEMLYLPAGWFHEVSSFGVRGDSGTHPQHMALNYWFHPPDSDSFERPYSTDFWIKDWQDRVEMGLK